MKAVLSTGATGFAVCERSPNAAGTLLSEQLELAAADKVPDSEGVLRNPNSNLF